MEPKIRFKGYMFGWVSEAIGLYYNFKNGLIRVRNTLVLEPQS